MYITTPVDFVCNDAFNQPVTLVNTSNSSFDWTGVPVRIQFRKSPTDKPLFELATGTRSPNVEPANFATLTVDATTLGTLAFSVLVPGSATSKWPQGGIFADVLVGVDGGTIGPFTPLRLSIMNNRSVVNQTQ